MRKDLGVAKRKDSGGKLRNWLRRRGSAEIQETYVRMAFIYFPFFRKVPLREHRTTCAPGQFREFREVVGAHTSGNGDGGMVDNIMMASAGRGGAGLRGDQYYPPPPPLPFPRPMHLSFSLSPSLSISLFLLHPRLTFPQTPSRVSPPMRPPSPSPPYECQVALPSTGTRGFLLRLVLRLFSLLLPPSSCERRELARTHANFARNGRDR